MNSRKLIILLFIFSLSYSQTQSIYFISEKNSQSRDLFLLKSNQKNPLKITQDLGGRHYPHFNSPKLSPDGTKILIQADPDGHDRYTIWLMNLDGTGIEKLTKKEGLFPNWSPDGKSIVYTGRRNGVWEILIKKIASNDEINLTKYKRKALSPGWGASTSFHPSGNFFVFSHIREKVLSLFDLKSQKITILSKQGESYSLPIFSRDGKSIMVNKKFGDHYNLVRYTLADKSEKIIIKKIVSYSAVSESFSQNILLFARNVNGNNEIFQFNIKTGVEKQLSFLNDFSAMPMSN